LNWLLKIKKIDGLLFLLSILVFIYVAIRAYTLSFTHDESVSFELIKWSSQTRNTANHHYINSVLMNFMRGNFGESEFVFRLPNVLSFALFLKATHLILKLFSVNNLMLIIGFVLIVFNPYLLDFFSLARGYGISLGCMMMSLYFYLKNCYKEYSLYNFWFSMLFATIAIGANLTLINFYLMIFGLQTLTVLKNNDYKFKRILSLNFILPLIVFIYPVYLSIERLLFLSDKGELYYGVDNLFEAFQSLLLGFLYNNVDENFVNIYNTFIVIVVIVFISLLITSVVYLALKINRPIIQITLMLAGIVVAIYTENLFFNAKFPFGRTALFFIPFISLMTYLFINEIAYLLKSKLSKNLMNILFGLLIVPYFSYNLITNLNKSQTFEWSYDADTKNIVKVILSDIANDYTPYKKYTISSNWIIAPTINYYLNSNRIPIPFVSRNGLLEESDYLIEYKSVPIQFKNFVPISHFTFTDFVVYKKID
jgi:hypothetical protein